MACLDRPQGLAILSFWVGMEGRGLEGLCVKGLPWNLLLQLALLPVGVDHWLMLVGTGKSETQTLDMRPVVGEGHFSV